MRQRLKDVLGIALCGTFGLLTSIWGWLPQLLPLSGGSFLVLTATLATIIAWQTS